MANKLTTLAQLREAAAKAQGRIAAVALAAANAVQEVADNLANHTHSWGSITGKPDTFTPASHNHDRLVTEGDNRSTATAPNDYYNTLRFRGLKQNDAIGYPSNDNYSYLIGWRGWTDSSGGYSREIAANNSGIYTRTGESTSWGAWSKLLSSSNFKEAVTLASLGAAAEGHSHAWDAITGKPALMEAGDYSSDTIEELLKKVQGFSPRMGSANLQTSTHGMQGWYNFIYTPHRTGIGGDNPDYGALLLFPLNFSGSSYIIRAAKGGVVADIRRIYTTSDVPTKSDVGLGNVDNTADGEKSVKYAASAGGVAWGNVTDKPSTYTPASHTHTKNQITDFPASMPASDVYTWAKQSTKPSYSKAEVGLGNVDNTADSAKSVKYAATAGGVAWDNVTGKPSTYTPASHTHAYLPLSGGEMAGDITFSNVGTGIRQIRFTCADNDYGRIAASGTDSNAGYMEISTADDGSEPIYVRQYSGVYATLVRQATLLDGSGNTVFPGTVTASRFIGKADTAGTADSAASANAVAWGNVTNKPSTYTPTSHTHTKSQITDFPTSMPASDVYAWAKQSTKPSYSKAEVGLGNVDNTADSAKSVNYAASAGSATSASNVGGFTFAASTTDLTAGSSALATNQVYFVYS